jgi:type II secretory pathway component GspD/PulD (secretin)
VDHVPLPRRLLACGWWLVLTLAAASPASAQAPRMPTLPLTQLEESGPAADLDNRTFTLTFAQPVPIKDLLLLLVRGTNLSLIPDPAIAGAFIGELKNVTVRNALDSILPPLGLDYRVDAGFIRVFARERETRIFDINYIAAERSSTSTLGGGGGDAGGAARATGAPQAPAAVSSASVSTVMTADLFADLTNGIQTLLSEGAPFNLDRKAGLLQVTDFPERLDRIGDYLDAVEGRVQRQVEFDARIVEIELKDVKATGVDWGVITAGLSAGPSTPPAAVARRSLTGLRVTDLPRFLTLLGEQGTVNAIQNNRLVTLNNEPAIVRSETLTLSITPQIASDGVVMLSLTPMLKAPAMAESDTLARVSDGETLIISGFTRVREVRERTNQGLRGGWFGRGTVVTQRRVEILILLTPRIL